MYDQLLDPLRQAYDAEAERREASGIVPWKEAERERFLSLLQEEGVETLLEIGAGPGKYAKFFQDNGLSVVCTDLSPQMVRLCRAKGLDARVMDFLHLDFPPSSFDAVFALNCLLHVPKADLPRVLRGVRALLKPGGLFYLGQYGGMDHEGVWQGDQNEPKRFFSEYTDEGLRRVASKVFEVLSFRCIPMERFSDPDFHFQAMILRRAQCGTMG